MIDKPDDLHAREYAMQILENLGWPNDRGQSPNLVLITDCLIAISKAKKLTPAQAHGYLERAIRLAREQYVTVDRFFFRDGVYMHMRPVQKMPEYKPIDRERVKREQSTPEFAENCKKIDELLRQISGKTKMPGGK